MSHPERLSRADERAIGKLLAGADQAEVMRLILAINHYEATVAEARARLSKRRPFTPSADRWQGGYAAAMMSIHQLVGGMAEVTENPYRILRAVIETAAAASSLGWDMPPWLADAAGSQP